MNSHDSEMPFSEHSHEYVLNGEGPGEVGSTWKHRDVRAGRGEGQDPLLGLQESVKVNQEMRKGLLESWVPVAHTKTLTRQRRRRLAQFFKVHSLVLWNNYKKYHFLSS